jgi:hypothetical protein
VPINGSTALFCFAFYLLWDIFIKIGKFLRPRRKVIVIAGVCDPNTSWRKDRLGPQNEVSKREGK